MADHTPVAVPKGCPSQRCELSIDINRISGESVSKTPLQGDDGIQPNESSDCRKCIENGALHNDDRPIAFPKSENCDLPTMSVVDLELSHSRSKNQSVCSDSSIMGAVKEMKLSEKVNGITHSEHSSGNNELLNLLNTCCHQEVSVSGNPCCDDSGRGSGSVCQSTETDCDGVSCEEIGIVDKRPPEVLCDSEHSEVNVLLTNLEKVSISQLSSSDTDDISNDEINDISCVDIVVYESEKQMPDIMRLITKDLSEPYSIYTYRYFIHNWPKLCFLAMADEKCVGAIVCKLDLHKKMVRRGYIAMLAVDSEYRRRQIGSTLVTKAIEAMIRDDCDEVVLETEITNQGALHLYENLGFVRDKRLFRYYLNGVDALRLKLWLR